MDPPLRKRLADLEKRRNTLIQAMSKFQDAKKSALFQYLNEKRDDNDEGVSLSSSCHGITRLDNHASFPSRYRTAVHTNNKEDRDAASSSHNADLSSRTTRSLPTPVDESVRSMVSSDSLRREQRSIFVKDEKHHNPDDTSTHLLKNPPFRNNKNHSDNDSAIRDKNPPSCKSNHSENDSAIRDKYFLEEDSDAPSDEVKSHDGKGGDTPTWSRLSEETRNTLRRETFNYRHKQQQEASKRIENPPTIKKESATLAELKKNIKSKESPNQQGKHPLIARLRQLKEMNRAYDEQKIHGAQLHHHEKMETTSTGTKMTRNDDEPKSFATLLNSWEKSSEQKLSTYETKIVRKHDNEKIYGISLPHRENTETTSTEDKLSTYRTKITENDDEHKSIATPLHTWENGETTSTEHYISTYRSKIMQKDDDDSKIYATTLTRGENAETTSTEHKISNYQTKITQKDDECKSTTTPLKRRENTETTSTETKTYQTKINRNSRRGSKTKVDDRFRKLFVDSPTEENGEQKNTNFERCNKVSHGESSKALTGGNDLTAGSTASTPTVYNGAAAAAITRVDSHDSADRMDLLEKKLNMMISKKPLWQKALQDLYQDPFDTTIGIAASSSGSTKKTSSSGSTNQRSEADTICSSDAESVKKNSQRSEITTPVASGVQSRLDRHFSKNNSNDETICSSDASNAASRKKNSQKSEREISMDSGIKSRLDRHFSKNSSNDSGAETDTLESWPIHSSCSADTVNTDVLIAAASRHLRNDINNTVDNDGKSGKKGEDGSSDTETDTIDSQPIQNAKNYLDTLPECLSDLYDGSTIEEKIEKESQAENGSVADAKTVSLRPTESEESIQKGEAQMFSATQLKIRTTWSQSSAIEGNNKETWAMEDERVENDEAVEHIESLPTPESDESSIPPVEEEWVTSLRAGFMRSLKQPEATTESQRALESQVTTPLHEAQMVERKPILTVHSQLSQKIEVEIQSPNKTSRLPPERSDQSTLQQIQSLDFESEFEFREIPVIPENQQGFSGDAEQQLDELLDHELDCESVEQIQDDTYDRNYYVTEDYSKEQSIESLEFETYEDVFESYEELEVESYSLQMNRIDDEVNAPSHDDEYLQMKTEEQQLLPSLESDSSSCVYVDVEIDYRHITQIDDTNVSVHDVETVSLHLEQQRTEKSLESNQWETPNVSNARNPFFSQQQNEQNETRELLIETEKFVENKTEEDFDMNPQDRLCKSNFYDCGMVDATPQGISTNSNFYDFGMVSDLSEGSTLSLEVSSSSGGNSIGEDGFNSDGDVSEASSAKPQIPNEVTMLTAFTVQSITYESNQSNVESLGEESVVQEYQMNRKEHSFRMMSSNSESTIVAEKRKKKKKSSALEVAKPSKMTCSEGLMKIISNPALLCQCTGPVALEAVISSSKKCSRR